MCALAITAEGLPEPCPGRFNMAAYVLARAAENPDKIALRVLSAQGAEDWSYGRLSRAVAGLATGLAARARQAGIRRGAPVLLRLANSVEFPLAFPASIHAGLVPVPTSAALTAAEVERIAGILRPRLIIAGRDGQGRALPLPRGGAAQVIGSAEIAALCRQAPMPPRLGAPDRPAYVVFTSGTGGLPRGVVHAHRAVWARRMMWQGWAGLGPEDRVMHAGAFNWTYTLGTGLMDPWAAGAQALIPAEGTALADLPALMARHGATIFAAAPGVYRNILKSVMPRLDVLRHGLSAGEKLPEVIRADWQAVTGLPLLEDFGMSECSTFISENRARPAPAGAVGYAQPGRRVAILDEHGPAERGKEGDIAIHASDQGLMLRYLGPGSRNEMRRRRRGDWFVTGDRGLMAADGAIHVLGRSDDVLNAGGYRVAPEEIEAAFAGAPGLAECAAVEEEVRPGVRIIALHYVAAAPLDEAALAALAAQRLAGYKRPRVYHWRRFLPRSANGKLMRRALRDAAAGHVART